MKAPGPEQVIADPHDLTGEWDGTFAYEGGEGATPFRARITENCGSFSGTIIEPHYQFSDTILTANCAGSRAGRAVDFTKSYIAPSADYENPVDYVGQLSGDGLMISGVWSLLDWNGTFEMHRETSIGIEKEAETADAVPTSV